MVPSFIPSLETIQEHDNPDSPPPTFDPTHLSKAKRHRSESPGGEGPSTRKRRSTAQQRAPSASPPPLFDYLQTPTSSTCLYGEPDVSFTEHDDQLEGCEFPTSSDVEFELNELEERNQASLAPAPGREEEFDDAGFSDIDFDDNRKVLETRCSPNQVDAEESPSLEYWYPDEYALDDVPKSPSNKGVTEPPSSVVRAFDYESRSAVEYDPQLRRSPVSSSSSCTIALKDETPLEQPVDWAHVHECAQTVLKPTTSPGSQEVMTPVIAVNQPLESASIDQGAKESGTAAASSLGPLSARMLMKPRKTFFHIQEMLDAKTQLFQDQPEAVFELFARVVYSSRENIFHKQYFQFRSLLKEAPPYINGTLTG